jgi:peptide/nickel transport system substrate-binding protein
MNTKRTVRVALAGLAAAGLIAGVLTPAQAATRSTVVVHDTNPMTGFNSSVSGYNLTANTAIGYMTGAGFNYYDDKKNLVKNTTFGTYKVVKSSATDFRVQYTVNPGRVWSDGTPITGVDLLLSHVVCSNAYSIAAGLGDPKAATKPSFEASCYSGTYNDFIVGDPELSADKMSVTVRYKGKLADWELYGPGPSPVHSLVLMADGKKALGTAAENLAAKDKFLAAFQTKNTTDLKKIAAVWSKDYNINAVDSSTNPLLFISNGGYIVKSAIAKQSVTLTANKLYNSGPAMSGSVDTVVFKYITDGNAASQALANGELDLYSGQATADAVAALKQIKGVTVDGYVVSTYEHWDLRVAAAQGQPEYTGVFKASDGQKSLDLRRAFLMGIPRQEIIDKLIKPVNPKAQVLNSVFAQQGMDIYDSIVRTNGSSFYSGDQETLNKRAIALVKKWYPNAIQSPIKVKVLVPGNNARRAAEFALVQANLRKIGFDLVGDVQASWSPRIANTEYDVVFFAWAQNSTAQAGTNANWLSDGSNNRTGVAIPALDRILKSVTVPLSRTVLAQKYVSAERILMDQGLTVPVFQHPGVVAYNSALKNVKPAPLSPNLVWNYWEWAY